MLSLFDLAWKLHAETDKKRGVHPKSSAGLIPGVTPRGELHDLPTKQSETAMQIIMHLNHSTCIELACSECLVH